jgi:hypothetical protein
MDIQIFLRDKNGELATAWSKIFSGYSNVDVSCGDIFDLKVDAIINPANSFGFMDGGIGVWLMAVRSRLRRGQPDGF